MNPKSKQGFLREIITCENGQLKQHAEENELVKKINLVIVSLNPISPLLSLR